MSKEGKIEKKRISECFRFKRTMLRYVAKLSRTEEHFILYLFDDIILLRGEQGGDPDSAFLKYL